MTSKTTTATLTTLLDHADGDSRTVMRQLVNAVADARGLTPPWDVPPATGLEPLGDLARWGVVELGEARLALASARQRDAHGMVYTPPEIVDFQVRSAMQVAGLDRLAGNPRALDHITIVDPACGPGIYIVHCARYLARWYAAQLAESEPADWMVKIVLPFVMVECLYGIDLDEVAVDLAKSVCWLEINGDAPITFMDDNIVIADTFADDLPRHARKLAARWPRFDAAPHPATGATR
ncbi:hypothetical protein ABT340_39355 [Streptosporangium sp. NPDC000239]|uniref:hypothetical protein n=1 Tax=Streptosporangium sp. NPDC000239 TaxID=3154248 RepID=UPI00332E5572